MDPILSVVTLRDVGTALLDLAMPRRCVVCRRPLGLRERFICLHCLADFPFTHFWERSHNPMADTFNAIIQKDLDEGGSGPREPYAFAAALFFYNSDSDYRHIPWHLKYEGGLAAGRFFARKLGERLAASPQFADVDIVVPVPLHWTRHWRRGYNQAGILACEIADVLGAELRTDILRRARRTRSQVRLPVAAKAANVRGAFTLRHPPAQFFLSLTRRLFAPGHFSPRRSPVAFPTDRPEMRATHILLVDDTYTTGSTMNACRAVLRKAFPLPTLISVATLAFVTPA